MNLSDKEYGKVVTSQLLLRLTYGFLFLLTGADKFLNLITTWDKYVKGFSIFEGSVLLVIFGLIEIAIGLLILMPRYTKIGAYVASLWLILFSVYLLGFLIYYETVMRNIVMAMGAIALGLLTKVVSETQQ